MIIINSGTYIVPEFQSELGRIPPCLLPLGNRKLIEHQVEALSCLNDSTLFVTLPDDYDLYADDQLLFDKLAVRVLRVSPEMSLAEAVLVAVSSAALVGSSGEVHLLHGDTLLYDFPQGKSDILGVGIPQDSYSWQKEVSDYSEQSVWCGYFSFQSMPTLIQCLAVAKNSFVDAVNIYRQKKGMETHFFTSWFDLGHINTYFKSRARITTERAFNDLRIAQNIVWKTGLPKKKIEAEAHWYQTIPTKIKRFVPQLIDADFNADTPSYQLEYLPLVPLNELFVHGRKEALGWHAIAEQLIDFLQEATSSFSLNQSENQQIKQDYTCLVADKTRNRLMLFSQENNFDLSKPISFRGITMPCVQELAEECINASLRIGCRPAVLHGDLCFSNILFNSRQDQLKLIDPRGLTADGHFSIYGNQFYDIAKLMHSVVGLYDFILAGRYTYCEKTPYNFDLTFSINAEIKNIQSIFKNLLNPLISFQDVKALVVLLFLSMLPLHSDRPDRQKAMLANAYKIHLTE